MLLFLFLVQFLPWSWVQSTCSGPFPGQQLIVELFPFQVVSLTGQIKLEPCPDWSPFGVLFKFSDKYPCPFHLGIPLLRVEQGSTHETETLLNTAIHCLNYPNLLPYWPRCSVGRTLVDLIQRLWVQTPPRLNFLWLVGTPIFPFTRAIYPGDLVYWQHCLLPAPKIYWY